MLIDYIVILHAESHLPLLLLPINSYILTTPSDITQLDKLLLESLF